MIRSILFASTLLAAASLAPAPSHAANQCKTDTLSCATTMPVGGYCECTKSGKTEDGTVMAAAPRGRSNSTAGGCGANPSSPGCR